MHWTRGKQVLRAFGACQTIIQCKIARLKYTLIEKLILKYDHEKVDDALEMYLYCVRVLTNVMDGTVFICLKAQHK